MTSTSAAGAYAEVAYPGFAYPQTHPARIAAVARLFGMTPAATAGARVLELGCGDGGNALAIAQTLPQAHVIGVDLSADAIQRGRRLARAAGLSNVELHVGDLADATSLPGAGIVDYVIAHGVYSWIPPAARGALLEVCRRALAPHGIAFVSYNAYPGSYLRDMARDILAFHLRDVTEPGERLARAQGLMRTIVAAQQQSPYAAVLREHLQRMLGASEALLYHDDLAPISTPFYFHEFMEHAAAHGLGFLSEADLASSQLRDVPDAVGELIGGLPPDVVVREQYLDFFTNRMFRQTLLVHADAVPGRDLDSAAIRDMAVSTPLRRDGDAFVAPGGARVPVSDPLVAAALTALCACRPGSLAFDVLVQRAVSAVPADALPVDPPGWLEATVLEAYLRRVIVLETSALPACRQPATQPVASPLARAQLEAGLPQLTTLAPGNTARPDEASCRVLALLDGTRGRADLAAELSMTEAAVGDALAMLGEAGLLMDRRV